MLDGLPQPCVKRVVACVWLHKKQTSGTSRTFWERASGMRIVDTLHHACRHCFCSLEKFERIGSQQDEQADSESRDSEDTCSRTIAFQRLSKQMVYTVGVLLE